MGTQEEMHGSSHTSKSRMGTRGCGRGYAPETGNGTWGVSPGPSSTPVSCKDSGSHQPVSGLTWTATMVGWALQQELHPACHFPGQHSHLLPSAFLVILCHPSREHSPCKASASCVLTCGCPKALSPVPSSCRSHTPHLKRFAIDLVYPTFSSWHANHYHLSLALLLWVQKSLKAFLLFLNSPGQAGSDLDQPMLVWQRFQAYVLSWTSSASLSFS